MLASITPFPQQGSYALLELDGVTHAVRIINRNDEEASVSLIGTTGASGNRRVALADLLDPTPLTDCDRCEMRLLAASSTRKSKKLLDELRLRDIRSETLAALLAQAERQAA